MIFPFLSLSKLYSGSLHIAKENSGFIVVDSVYVDFCDFNLIAFSLCS